MDHELRDRDVYDFDVEIWASIDDYACFAGLGNVVVILNRCGLGHCCHVGFELGLLGAFKSEWILCNPTSSEIGVQERAASMIYTRHQSQYDLFNHKGMHERVRGSLEYRGSRSTRFLVHLGYRAIHMCSSACVQGRLDDRVKLECRDMLYIVLQAYNKLKIVALDSGVRAEQ